MNKTIKFFGDLWCNYSKDGDIEEFNKLPFLGKVGYLGFITSIFIKTGLTPKNLIQIMKEQIETK